MTADPLHRRAPHGVILLLLFLLSSILHISTRRQLSRPIRGFYGRNRTVSTSFPIVVDAEPTPQGAVPPPHHFPPCFLPILPRRCEAAFSHEETYRVSLRSATVSSSNLNFSDFYFFGLLALGNCQAYTMRVAHDTSLLFAPVS